MKEILTIASNFFAVWTDEKKLIPQVEIILVLSEPHYNLDDENKIVRTRVPSQVRFSASPDSLLKMAAMMIELAGEAESIIQIPATEGEKPK